MRKTENLEEREIAAEAFSQAIAALKRSEVIVFPTETFYGLGADAFDGVAVERVFSLKGRNPENPIPIIIADGEMLKGIVTEIPPVAQKLMDRFWPGPLTLILPAQKGLPAPLLNRDGGIGVRISSHPLASQLTRELGHPITATSANLSGQEPARTLDEAVSYFANQIKIFLGEGRLAGKKGSTVVAVLRDKLRIIREGEISVQELEKALADKS
ncbi:MAG: threonylcarbamoyl-AMP synthase [Deltaproteobacteria bacterium]|nr:threonylcarbamoyl-AMP synthase [Deltaproteobacteria bacterium]